MGKKQHQKDKMYLTCTEWSTFYGGKKSGPDLGEKAEFRRLPFDHCALSFQPFEHPLCTPEGIIYDLMNIIPFLKKFGVDPATGKPLDIKSLVKLNFHKNSEGKYHCPVLYKVFNQNSHIVAIKPTGNVFSYEALEELNIKTKNFKDLLTDETFQRKDIITLQDPSNLEKFNFSNFYHLKKNLKIIDEEEEKAKASGTYTLKAIGSTAKNILDELNKEYKPPEKKEKAKIVSDKFNAAHFSTGAVAAGFTSTVCEPTTKLESAILEDDVVRYTRVKKKGYVQLLTNCGPLNLELHCDLTPKTCENFIKLCQNNYYNDTIFHRSIRNFMIQGGDPTGTGKGGKSIWGQSFKDEFRPNLSHQGRGILSMANSGKDTNKSQFFITFRSCQHLDGKHTIFGRVVGGLDTLNNIERIETDDKDKPIEDIKILKTTVFVNPYEEVDEQLAKERAEEYEKKEEEKKSMALNKQTTEEKSIKLKVFRKGVGKYLDLENSKETDVPTPSLKKKKKAVTEGFGDFSSW
ncbi:RING-type E3 ubiquitin-protein ligase PPIL2 isoform X1 [Tachypleus tridentatus]|uniref:RING-type E3 ubiquitin-protein ligase PPIL2 isoform X1 n=2 Tax=Tachypleus tridentatus TaxID=6853 RepID=UPI003FD4E523